MKSKNTMWMVLGTLGQVGYIIALPAAFMAYFGHKLDQKFNTSPWFLVAGIGIAITISSLGVYRLIRRIEKQG